MSLAVSLLVFCTALAGFDALYFHYYREQIHRRESSRVEHRLHLGLGVGFVGVVWWLYLVPRLELAVIALTIQWCCFVVDMVGESWTRKDQGGLSRAERRLHWVSFTGLMASNILAAWKYPLRLSTRETASLRWVIALAGGYLVWQWTLGRPRNWPRSLSNLKK